jgi:hypothetical protein
VAIATPFVGMALDFSGWWLARLDAFFCDFIIVGGALTGVGMAALVLLSLADAWFPEIGGARTPSPSPSAGGIVPRSGHALR